MKVGIRTFGPYGIALKVEGRQYGDAKLIETTEDLFERSWDVVIYLGTIHSELDEPKRLPRTCTALAVVIVPDDELSPTKDEVSNPDAFFRHCQAQVFVRDKGETTDTLWFKCVLASVAEALSFGGSVGPEEIYRSLLVTHTPWLATVGAEHKRVALRATTKLLSLGFEVPGDTFPEVNGDPDMEQILKTRSQ